MKLAEELLDEIEEQTMIGIVIEGCLAVVGLFCLWTFVTLVSVI